MWPAQINEQSRQKFGEETGANLNKFQIPETSKTYKNINEKRMKISLLCYRY